MDQLIYKQLHITNSSANLNNSKENNINKEEEADQQGNKKEICTSNHRYCHAKHNNNSENCGMCLRNLSRAYSEADVSLVLSASHLLNYVRDGNEIGNANPVLSQRIGDISFDKETDRLLQNYEAKRMFQINQRYVKKACLHIYIHLHTYKYDIL